MLLQQQLSRGREYFDFYEHSEIKSLVTRDREDELLQVRTSAGGGAS